MAALSAPQVSIAAILEHFHERGLGVLLFVLALPAGLPIPVLNSLLAIPLVFLTAQQALGRHTVWMPRKVKQKTFPTDRLQAMMQKFLPIVHWSERLIKPRLGFLTQGIFSQLIGLSGLCMALITLMPLPGLHTVPCMGIACMAVGVMARDGLAVLFGMLIGLGWIGLIVFFGHETLQFLAAGIKSMS